MTKAAAQSPWARNNAGFYAQLGYHFIPTYTTLYGGDTSEISLIREVEDRTVQFYAEYGLPKRTTLMISVPYRFVSRGARNPDNPYFFAREDTGSISGLGNVTLALKHQFVSGKTAMNGSLRVDFPANKSLESAGLRTGFDALTIQPTFSAGQGYSRFYWYTYGGFLYRTNHYSHSVNLGFEGGYHLGPVWLIGFSELLYSLENGSRKVTGLDGLTGLYVNNQGWLSVGLKGIWEINRFAGIVISAAGAPWAQYVPVSPGLGMAVYFKWE